MLFFFFFDITLPESAYFADYRKNWWAWRSIKYLVRLAEYPRAPHSEPRVA